MNKHMGKKIAAISLAAMITIASFPMHAFAAPFAQETEYELDYIISNPYETVNWESFSQYKADFHAHSRNSDGGNLTSEIVEDHYAKGFDILAMTDHNYTTKGWENAGQGPVTLERKAEIEAGVGRDGRGMLDFSYSNEQSRTDHINTFLVDWKILPAQPWPIPLQWRKRWAVSPISIIWVDTPAIAARLPRTTPLKSKNTPIF